MPRPGFGRGGLGAGALEQALWSRVSGVAGAVTCSRGTSKNPCGSLPPPPHCHLPGLFLQPPPPARRSDSARPVPGSRDAASGRLTPRYRLQPLPAAPFRAGVGLQGRVSPRGAPGAAPDPLSPGSGEGGVGKPKVVELKKSGIGWRSRRMLGVEGKGRKDGAEFFPTGQVLTRVEQARAEPGKRVPGIHAGTWAGEVGAGGTGEDEALHLGGASAVLPRWRRRWGTAARGIPLPALSPSAALGRPPGAIHPAPLRASSCCAVPKLDCDPEAAAPWACSLTCKVASYDKYLNNIHSSPRIIETGNCYLQVYRPLFYLLKRDFALDQGNSLKHSKQNFAARVHFKFQISQGKSSSAFRIEKSAAHACLFVS